MRISDLSIRQSAWLAFFIAMLSFPANGLALLLAWFVLATAFGTAFAGSHTPVIYAVALVAHTLFYAVPALTLWLLLRTRYPAIARFLPLVIAIVYAIIVVVSYVLWVQPALNHL